MVCKIELNAMKFYAYHGVDPQETKVGNQFVVDLVLTADIYAAVCTDELTDTINYADVYQIVKKEMEIPSRLLEHVAGRIVKSLKKQMPQIEHVFLRLA